MMINEYNKEFPPIFPFYFLTSSKENPLNYQKNHFLLVIYLIMYYD
jgi:hypothetical protein